MVTFEALRDADLRPLRQAAERWKHVATSVGEYEQTVRREVAASTRSGVWTGIASVAADVYIGRLEGRLRLYKAKLVRVAAILNTACDEISKWQHEIRSALSDAGAAGLEVADYGTVTVSQGAAAVSAQAYPLAQALNQGIQLALREATIVDKRAAEALRTAADLGLMDTRAGAALTGEEILHSYQVPADPGGMVDYGWVAKLTRTEADMLDELPLRQKYHFWQIERDAFSWANTRFGGTDEARTNGPGDAWRHAYWSALLSRNFGEDWGERFTDAHEGSPDNNELSEAMDLHNNEVGRRISRENPDASEEDLRALIEQAVRDGEMIVIYHGRLVRSDQVELPSSGDAADAGY